MPVVRTFFGSFIVIVGFMLLGLDLTGYLSGFELVLIRKYLVFAIIAYGAWLVVVDREKP